MGTKKMFEEMNSTTCEKYGNDEYTHDITFKPKHVTHYMNGMVKIHGDEGFRVRCRICNYEWFVKGK